MYIKDCNIEKTFYLVSIYADSYLITEINHFKPLKQYERDLRIFIIIPLFYSILFYFNLIYNI